MNCVFTHGITDSQIGCFDLWITVLHIELCQLHETGWKLYRTLWQPHGTCWERHGTGWEPLGTGWGPFMPSAHNCGYGTSAHILNLAS